MLRYAICRMSMLARREIVRGEHDRIEEFYVNLWYLTNG